MIISKSLKNRLNFIQKFQNELIQQFGDQYYNVFLFGSFLTDRYEPGKSDIDFAIYTKDFDLYLKIYVYIENYFNIFHIEQDIFYIDTTIIDPFYIAPLSSVLQFTSYYPEELKEFYQKCCLC